MQPRPDRPRLLITPARLDAIRAEPQLAEWIRAATDAMLALPPVERRMEGRRLLTVSRLALDRCTVLGLAHRLWGGPYADRLAAELVAVAGFSDWNPGHFLDVAEMAAAVGLGLDWAWEALPEDVRQVAAEAIVRHALVPGAVPGQFWHASDNNWNQVCHGGLVVAALALPPGCPEAAAAIAAARAGIRHGLAAYAPDGVYPEGVMYWEYGTTYSVLLADALATAAGEDWGIAAAPGLLASASFVRACTAPDGLPFSYGDANCRRLMLAPAGWLSARAGDADGAAWARQHLLARRPGNRFLAFAALWLPPPGAVSARPRAWLGSGPVHVACLRSGAGEAACWIGLKGGHLQVNHGHMDAGSFELVVDGVRWFTELGMEWAIYERTDGWGTGPGSCRWSYLRTSNAGHNLVVVGGRLQRVEGCNPIRLAGKAAVVDLTAAYADVAASAARGVALVGDDGVVIQDEFTGLPAEPLRWQAVTPARIVLDGATARLEHQDRVLHLRLLEPAGAVFTAADLVPPTADEDPNHGLSRLVVELPPAAGACRIRVLASRQPAATPPATPLAEWM